MPNFCAISCSNAAVAWIDSSKSATVRVLAERASTLFKSSLPNVLVSSAQSLLRESLPGGVGPGGAQMLRHLPRFGPHTRTNIGMFFVSLEHPSEPSESARDVVQLARFGQGRRKDPAIVAQEMGAVEVDQGGSAPSVRPADADPRHEPRTWPRRPGRL